MHHHIPKFICQISISCGNLLDANEQVAIVRDISSRFPSKKSKQDP